MTEPILVVKDLYKYFPVSQSVVDKILRRPQLEVKALDGISLSIGKAEIVALVGESGSGKTTLSMNILGLQSPTSGEAFFIELPLAKWAVGKLDDKDQRRIGVESKRAQTLEFRRRAQMIFQDPYESLNPRQSIWEIMAEPLEIHSPGLRDDVKERKVRTALEDCGLTPAEHFWDRYPDELSGGQRQRVVIASALVLEPDLLLADEPVSMLDVSIRADILSLLRTIRDVRGVTILYTTHDLATAGYFTDRMIVMYLGRIVEEGPTIEVLKDPKHPYTQALVSVAPAPNPRKRKQRVILKGELPNAVHIPNGCRFHPRCPIAQERCKQEDPQLSPAGTSRKVACFFAEGINQNE